MGELGEELGRVLKVFLINIWKHLSERTQHTFEVVGGVVLVLGLLNAIRDDLRSSSSGLKGAWRGLKALNIEIWKGAKILCRRLCAPANPEFIPAVIILFLAVFGTWPYNFYILARIIVCPTLIWLALLIHPKRKLFWEIPVVIFALIFNPIVRFHFAKETWGVFNVLAALAIIPAVYLRLKAIPKPPIIQPEIRQIEATALSALANSPVRKYKYCGSCSVRVGQSDFFCKRCGNAVQ
jgi:hypothetical protein